MKPIELNEEKQEEILIAIRNGNTEIADHLLDHLGYDIKKIEKISNKLYSRHTYFFKCTLELEQCQE